MKTTGHGEIWCWGGKGGGGVGGGEDQVLSPVEGKKNTFKRREKEGTIDGPGGVRKKYIRADNLFAH